MLLVDMVVLLDSVLILAVGMLRSLVMVKVEAVVTSSLPVHGLPYNYYTG